MHCFFSVMIAELMILVSVEEDLSDLEELWALIKKIIALVWKGRVKEVDDEHSHSESPQTAEYSEVNVVGGFGGKNTGKPVPWDGDTEQEFKNWSERLTTYMANTGDKVWRKILEALQVIGDDYDSSDDVNHVKQASKHVGVGQQLVEALYDQVNQLHKGRNYWQASELYGLA